MARYYYVQIQVLFSLKAFKNVIKTTLNEAGVTYEIEEVMAYLRTLKHIRTINLKIFKSQYSLISSIK